MTFYEMLQTTGLNVFYGHSDSYVDLPFLIYLGGRADISTADNTIIYQQEHYSIEYYFKNKNIELEKTIETTLLNNGYIYSKSEDIYIDSEKCYVIYYEV